MKTYAAILSTPGLVGAAPALGAPDRTAGYPIWEYAVLAVVIAAAVIAVTTCCRRMASPHRP